jgi:hypothetical protein
MIAFVDAFSDSCPAYMISMLSAILVSVSYQYSKVWPSGTK